MRGRLTERPGASGFPGPGPGPAIFRPATARVGNLCPISTPERANRRRERGGTIPSQGSTLTLTVLFAVLLVGCSEGGE